LHHDWWNNVHLSVEESVVISSTEISDLSLYFGR